MLFQLHFTLFQAGRRPKYSGRILNEPDLVTAQAVADAYRRDYRRHKGILAATIWDEAGEKSLAYYDNNTGEWMPVQY
ncbi:MAG: hypothetical protein HDQ88_07005 [Clostridia bacterium]|nr:hypothetical protein [Clostridia bacterium]